MTCVKVSQNAVEGDRNFSALLATELNRNQEWA
jgi:hypothetical protein